MQKVPSSARGFTNQWNQWENAQNVWWRLKSEVASSQINTSTGTRASHAALGFVMQWVLWRYRQHKVLHSNTSLFALFAYESINLQLGWLKHMILEGPTSYPSQWWALRVCPKITNIETTDLTPSLSKEEENVVVFDAVAHGERLGIGSLVVIQILPLSM